jgi:hypothetical protein
MYQKVNIGKTVSESSLVRCGVPLGSIFGPLPFLCYVNDMVTSIDAGSQVNFICKW